MKKRFYNVLCFPGNRLEDGWWTDWNNNFFGGHDPKQLSLEEAKKFFASVLERVDVPSHYIILEMDANNKPIIPKYRKRMKYYNVWCNSGPKIETGHWTDYNHDYYGYVKEPGFSGRKPKPMTLDEARQFLKRILCRDGTSNSYIIFEMNNNNRPIIPKCRKK